MFRYIVSVAVVLSISLNPPSFGQSQVYSLEDFWEKAVSLYPSIRSDQAVTRQLAAERDLLRRARYPELRIQAQQNFGTHQSMPGSFFPLSGNFNTGAIPAAGGSSNTQGATVYGSGLLRWDLFEFGRQRKRIAAAGQAVQVGAAMQQEEVFLLQLRVAKLYLEVLQHDALLRAMKREEERITSLLEYTGAQVDAGLIPGADSTLLRSHLISAVAKMQEFIARKDAASQHLVSLTNIQAPEIQVDSVSYFHALLPAVELGGNHPQLEKLKEEVSYSEALLELAHVHEAPVVSLLAGAGLKGAAPLADGQFLKGARGAWDHSATAFLAGVGITWNLSSLYGAPLIRRKAAQRLEEVKGRYEARAVDLDAAYQATLQSRTHLAARRSKSFEALQLARAAFDMYRFRYETGLTDMISLLQLQKEVQEAEIRYVDAVNDYWNEVLQTAAASGDLQLMSRLLQAGQTLTDAQNPN